MAYESLVSCRILTNCKGRKMQHYGKSSGHWVSPSIHSVSYKILSLAVQMFLVWWTAGALLTAWASLQRRKKRRMSDYGERLFFPFLFLFFPFSGENCLWKLLLFPTSAVNLTEDTEEWKKWNRASNPGH